MKIPFGTVQIGSVARELLDDSLKNAELTEGKLVAEFEEQFAEKFNWTYAISKFEDEIILYREAPNEEISPHAFPVTLRKAANNMAPFNLFGDTGVMDLYRHLEDRGIECKTLFGSLPTQHPAFDFLGYRFGDFPVAERIGATSLHFSCGEFMEEEHIQYVSQIFEKFLKKA